jgi:hypothetical protein
MVSAPKTIALCTTIYPGVEPFLADWHASVLRQTDREFELWIASDGLNVDDAARAMGGTPEAVWVHAEDGDTPSMIRQRVLSQITELFEAVVLVDSDDLLHPGRVASARAGLKQSDLVACALRLVDQHGTDLGLNMALPPQTAPDAVLPRHNIFGFSNTAWRSDALRRCLPIPAEVAIVDWYVTTRAWLIGATLAFDPVVGMDYRQHGSNMVRSCAPFDQAQIVRDTERVRRHFRLVSDTLPQDVIPSRVAQMNKVVEDVERFATRIVPYPERLDRYTIEINALDPAPLWWTCVAHPSLKHLWSD